SHSLDPAAALILRCLRRLHPNRVDADQPASGAGALLLHAMSSGALGTPSRSTLFVDTDVHQFNRSPRTQLSRPSTSSLRLIPSPADQNRCAQLRRPIDMIFHGWSTSR